MIRFLADENFNGDIIRALRRRLPSIDLLTAADANLLATPDPAILEWAAVNGRIVVTSDAETMIGFAYARIASGLAMPGLFYSHQDAPASRVMFDLLLIANCSEQEEWANRVLHLPM